MCLVVTKPVFVVSVKARLKPVSFASETSYNIEILLEASLDMTFSNQRITTALIRLRVCAGWSAPLLFAKPRRQVLSWQGPFMSEDLAKGPILDIGTKRSSQLWPQYCFDATSEFWFNQTKGSQRDVVWRIVFSNSESPFFWRHRCNMEFRLAKIILFWFQDVAQDVGHISHLEILHQTMPSPKPYEPKHGERNRIDKIVLTLFNYYDVNWRISRWLSWQPSWNSSNDISSKTKCRIEPKFYGRDVCKFSFAKIVTFG